VVKLLVDKYHADVNLPDSEVRYKQKVYFTFPYLSSSQENTPLFFAVKNSHIEMVEYLLSVGAKVNTHCGGSKTTPLHLAVRQVHSLPRPPPKLNITNQLKQTQRNEAIFRLLAENGASFLATTNKNATVLHEAAEAGNLEMVQLILSFPDSMKTIDLYSIHST